MGWNLTGKVEEASNGLRISYWTKFKRQNIFQFAWITIGHFLLQLVKTSWLLCEMKHLVQTYMMMFGCLMVYFICLWYRKTQLDYQNKTKDEVE
jgi:uncharacterized membrane protein